MKRTALTALLLGSAGLWSAPASALELLANCAVSTSGIGFGDYSHLDGDHDNTGSVTITCTSLLSLLWGQINYEIKFSAGSSGSFTPRKMYSGSHALEYNLYTNSARNIIWGDGAGAVSKSGTLAFSLVSIGASRSDDIPVFGRIPGGQQVPAGAYSDSITVTVLY